MHHGSCHWNCSAEVEYLSKWVHSIAFIFIYLALNYNEKEGSVNIECKGKLVSQLIEQLQRRVFWPADI